MNYIVKLGLSGSEQNTLDEIGAQLRARGWADHVTVPYLIRQWDRLSACIDRYTLTVDEYTNDLTSRDGLEIVVAECDEPLRSKLDLYVMHADREFLARTRDDIEGFVGRYFRIEETDGWWWRRTPSAGPLADFLAQSE